MRSERIRKIWAEGGTVLNGWCGIPDSFAAELMAHAGWDTVTIDCQHGLVAYQAMVAMLQAISTSAAAAFVRVSDNDPAEIMKALDAGAVGIICPMINDAESCERFVAACRYPPIGNRSSGPTRSALYGGADYAFANRSVITIAMIETVTALENCDSILSTPGLDAVYVGPSDISLSLGLSGSLDKQDDVLLNAFSKILACCGRQGLPAGVHTNGPTYARQMLGMGFKWVTVSSDTKLLTNGARTILASMRDERKEAGFTPQIY
jgi:4-hydroxy-2-oxoheptanedioate aldolase